MSAVIKNAIAEGRDFGRLVGVALTYENENKDSVSLVYNLPFEVAESLMDDLWRAGCRPRTVETHLAALKTLMFGPKY